MSNNKFHTGIRSIGTIPTPPAPNTRSGPRREMKTKISLPNESLRNLSSTQPRKRPLVVELKVK